MSGVEGQGVPRGQAGGRGTIENLLSQLESRRRRAALYTLIPLFAILLAGFVILILTARNVRGQFERLEKEKATIAEQKRQVEEQKQEVERQKRYFEEATGGLGDAIWKYYNQSNPDEQKKLKEVIESSPTLTSVSARVYMQIHDEGQRPQARRIAATLKNTGFVVPGIERVPEKVAFNQVRFFRQEDEGLADQVSAVLADSKVACVRSVLDERAKVPPGQIEVWLAPAPAEAKRPASADCSLLDTPELDADIRQAVEKAESPCAGPDDRNAAAAAYLARAEKYHYNSGQGYRFYECALYDYRRVLKYDPGNAQVKGTIKSIESVFQQVGRPVPP